VLRQWNRLSAMDRAALSVRPAYNSAFSVIPLYNADNTNRDIKTRKYYIDVAQRLGIPVRYAQNVTSMARMA